MKGSYKASGSIGLVASILLYLSLLFLSPVDLISSPAIQSMHS